MSTRAKTTSKKVVFFDRSFSSRESDSGDKKPFNKNKKDFKGKKETEEQKKERDAKTIKRERQRREDPNFDLRCELKKLWEKLRNAGIIIATSRIRL